MSVLAVTTAQKISLAFGALYVLLGLLGFSPLVTYAAANPSLQSETIPGLLFGVFGVNTIHSLVNLILGGAMIWAGMSRSLWDMLTKTLAVVLLLLVAAGFVASFARMLAINPADNILYLITGLVFVYFATKVPNDDFIATR